MKQLCIMNTFIFEVLLLFLMVHLIKYVVSSTIFCKNISMLEIFWYLNTQQ